MALKRISRGEVGKADVTGRVPDSPPGSATQGGEKKRCGGFPISTGARLSATDAQLSGTKTHAPALVPAPKPFSVNPIIR